MIKFDSQVPTRFTFAVGGVQYESTQFTVAEGLPLSLRLTTVLGEPLVGLLAGAAAGGSMGSVLDGNIGDTLAKLDLSSIRETLSSGLGEAMVFDLLRNTYRDGVSLDSNAPSNALNEFRGAYASLYQVCWWVIVGNGLLPLPPGLLSASEK